MTPRIRTTPGRTRSGNPWTCRVLGSDGLNVAPAKTVQQLIAEGLADPDPDACDMDD